MKKGMARTTLWFGLCPVLCSGDFGAAEAGGPANGKRMDDRMSKLMEEGPLREVAILTRAVENVLRKLVQLLIGRMSLVKLQELLRNIYVEEARAKLQQERPGRNVPLTKLALLTGLDTRTLNKVVDELSDDASHERDRFLKEITPECNVLDLWESHTSYLDPVTKKPRELKLKSGDDVGPSFESLMRDASISRGVTVKSLLDRLVASKSVEIDRRNNIVRLLDRRYWPFLQKDQTATLEIGLISVGNLLGTIIHNLETKNHKADALYQRSSWTHRLSRKNQLKFREIVRDYLASAESRAREILREFEEIEERDDQLTAGIGFYCFEEEAA